MSPATITTPPAPGAAKPLPHRCHTLTVPLYRYADLQGRAKDRAREALTQGPMDHESTTSDAKTIAALMGWEIDRIRWSGFGCQGDGASFTGVMQYAKGAVAAVKEYAPEDETLHGIAQAWYDLQRKHFFKLRCRVIGNSSRHSHPFSVDISCTIGHPDNCHYPEITAQRGAADIARQFMQWIYRQLEAEYEHEISDANLAEICEANDYEFTEDGRLFNARGV